MAKLALHTGLLFVYYGIMRAVNKRSTKKARGRPATGQDPVTAIRLSSDLRTKIDKWSDTQEDRPARSVAIRRLIEIALEASPERKAATRKARVPKPMVLKMPGIQTD